MERRDPVMGLDSTNSAVGKDADSAGGGVSKTAQSPVGADSTMPGESVVGPTPLPAERSGRTIGGKYRLGKLLGRGGMGSVFEAEQLDLRRPVAIKMVSTVHAERQDVMARFEREARLAAAIGHENIIAVYDVGRTSEGEPYIVMERLEGASLRALLDGPEGVPLKRLLSITDQMLAALQAAHDRGIIHRDIKPENVFVCPGEERDRVKVLDFGISKMVRLDGDSLHLTQTGTLMGTPLYMSPEQAMGKSDLDCRADLYAVGVILYRALAGRFPFEAPNFNALVTAMVTTEAPSLGQLVPTLSPSLVALIGRALAKDREARFQTARDFRQALRNLSDAGLSTSIGTLPAVSPPEVAGADGKPSRALGEPVVAHQDTTADPQRRPLGWLWIGGAATLIAGVVTAVMVSASSRNSALPVASPPISVPTVVDVNTVPSPAIARRADEQGETAPSAPTRPEPPSAATVRKIAVAVRTQPETARVVIDGETYAPPVALQLTRAPGESVRIEVSAPGYLPFAAKRPRDEDVDLDVKLAPAKVRKGSTPSGAKGSRIRPKLE